jgi:hypothetical protein
MKVLLGLLLALSAPGLAAPTAFDFGVHLLREGEDYRAVVELERFRFFEPQSPKAQDALRLENATHFRGAQWLRAAEGCAEFAALYPKSNFAQEARFFESEARYEARQWPQARTGYESLLAQGLPAELAFTARLRLVSLRLLKDDWLGAADGIHQAREPFISAERIASLDSWEAQARQGATLRPRSVGLAVLESAIVPGWGQVSSGYLRDGLSAFVTVLTFAGWAAYSYSQDQKTPAAVFGSIGGLFYLGNLQAAFLSARRANDEKPKAIKKAILDGIGSYAPPQPDMSPYIEPKKADLP